MWQGSRMVHIGYSYWTQLCVLSSSMHQNLKKVFLILKNLKTFSKKNLRLSSPALKYENIWDGAQQLHRAPVTRMLTSRLFNDNARPPVALITFCQVPC